MNNLKINDLPVNETLKTDEAKKAVGGVEWTYRPKTSFGSIKTTGTLQSGPALTGDFKSYSNLLDDKGFSGIGADSRLASSNDAATSDSGAMGSPG